MNVTHHQDGFVGADEGSPLQRARDVWRFAPLAPLSTAGGCLVVVLCLWPLLPPWWAAWLASGFVLAGIQWRARHLVRSTGPAEQASDRHDWVVVNALVSGAFFGGTSVVLYPSGSIEHQFLLAFILTVITAIWLPFYAFIRLSLLAFAVPAVLPMAFQLLLSPSTPQTTMGSLLLLLIAVLATIAQLAGRMLHAESAARQELYHQATHDPLVGLANRAEFYRRTQTLEIMQTDVYAIAFVDLDHFKGINDSLGHAAGDTLLRSVGAVLRQSVRKGDTAARLGGDEFAILMKDCDAAEAAAVAAIILESIGTLGREFGGSARGPRVTASIGIACSADLCARPATLLEAADQACYRAKRAGRNRIEIAAGLPSSAPRPRNRSAVPVAAAPSL
jgi:diguanylate cyclase (GGDEF)-like protein